MRIFFSIYLVFIFFVSFVPSGFAQPAATIANSDNQFAFDLYSRLAANPGNIFFSPYSLTNALDMAYEGARGQTAQEMRGVLHLGPDDAARRAETAQLIQEFNGNGDTYELSVANALWAQNTYPLKAEYLKLVEGTYFAEARNLDFESAPEASRLTINDWVSDKTQERIKDLLPAGSITSATRLVLTNAVYFKSSWAIPFNRVNTRPDTFWLGDGRSVQTDMMMLNGESFWYTDNDQAQILQLSYKRNDLSMIIILPRSRDIQGLEKSLTLGMLTQWQESMVRQEVNVFLPKFKFDSSYQMNGVLMEMGMRSPFEKNADFSGMEGNNAQGPFYLGLVIHKAWIDTDETGTEAAAATGITMLGAAVRVNSPEPKIFRADHPFIFVIQDSRTGGIIFMGRVSSP